MEQELVMMGAGSEVLQEAEREVLRLSQALHEVCVVLTKHPVVLGVATRSVEELRAATRRATDALRNAQEFIDLKIDACGGQAPLGNERPSGFFPTSSR